MVEKLRARFDDFRRVWRRDGLGEAITVSVNHVRSNPGSLLLRDPAYQDRRVDNDERWRMMEARIVPGAGNALDLGCNRGAITRRAAASGLFSIGVDRKATIVDAARRRTTSPNCHYIQQDIEPGDIERLPRFDVGFLLAVYYHWGKFGWSTAEDMLRELADRTDQLFVETPNDLEHIDSEVLDATAEPRPALQSYFEAVVGDGTVEYVGETPYYGGDRSDLIFEIGD